MRNKTFIIISILLVGALLAACGSIPAAQALTPTAAASDNTPPIRTISVSGSGKAYLTPDIAYINIGVHNEGKDAAETVAGNTTQSQKVIDALKKLGIDTKDIRTTNFSIFPQQQYDQQGKPTGEITYVVDNTVYVTVRNLDKIGDILDGAVKAGANSINGIQFDVADKNQALSDARKSAMADAKAQAEELAQAAGVTLGQVQSISLGTEGFPPPVVYGKGGGAMATPAEAPVPVSPGQMIVTVDVSVVYQIQ